MLGKVLLLLMAASIICLKMMTGYDSPFTYNTFWPKNWYQNQTVNVFYNLKHEIELFHNEMGPSRWDALYLFNIIRVYVATALQVYVVQSWLWSAIIYVLTSPDNANKMLMAIMIYSKQHSTNSRIYTRVTWTHDGYVCVWPKWP